MIHLPTNPSAAVRKRNPHLFGDAATQPESGQTGRDPKSCCETRFFETPRIAKRIRQSSKPIMNVLEQSWFDVLNAQFPNYPRPRAQAKRYRTSHSSWYKPDITASQWPQENGPPIETAWECKGPKQMKNIDRGILSLKVAASQWPEVRFILVWRENNLWRQQIVLP